MALSAAGNPCTQDTQDTQGASTREAHLSRLRSLVKEASQAEAAQDPDGSLALYEEALILHGRLAADMAEQNAALRVFSVRGRASALFSLGRYRELLETAADAESAIDVLPESVIELLRLRSAAYSALGLPERAEEALNAASAHFENLRAEGDVEWAVTINLLCQTIRAKLNLGHYEEALAAADRALEEAWHPRWESLPHAEATVASAEGTILALRGTALCVLARADPSRTEAAEASLTEVLENEAAFPVDRELAGTYLLLLRLLQGDHTKTQALLDQLEPSDRHAMSRSAARARIVEGAGDPRAIEALRTELRGHLEAFVATWSARADGAGFGILRDRLARFALEQVLALHEGQELIDVLLQLQSPASLSLSRSRVTSEDVLATLVEERDVGCLVLQPGWDRGRAVAFDGERIASFVLPGGHNLMQRARRYELLLAQDPGLLPPRQRERRAKELHELGMSLADSLFPPDLRAFVRPWRSLRIVGRNLLHELSLETLPVFDEAPLGITHAVTNLPSLAAGVALTSRPAPTDGDVLLLAAPTIATSVRARFPWIEDLELDPQLPSKLEERLGSTGELQVLSGTKAHPTALREGLAARPRALHVVSHGVLDPSMNVWPHMALAPDRQTPDGLLGYEATARLDVPALVVLSACETGKGAERLGDAGSYHLGGAFLEAGARTVVLSAQRIRLGAALAFSHEIYASLGRKEPIAAAMQRARGKMRKSEAFSDPFYWGSTFVYGLGD